MGLEDFGISFQEFSGNLIHAYFKKQGVIPPEVSA